MFLNPKRTGSKVMWPENFKDPYLAKESFVESFRITTVYKQDSSNTHIYFMHGGAYTMEPVIFHMNIIRKLVDCGYTVSFIDYPLTPENTVEKTLAVANEGFKLIAQEYPTHNFVFIGDSSGGGLALALQMQLRDENYSRRPTKTLLFSPWLDVTMSYDDQAQYEKSDKILDRKVLKKIGSTYAGSVDNKHWSVSPIYGNLNSLGKFFVFYSDSEVLRTDSDRFINAVKTSTGTSAETYLEHKASHDYIMVPHKKKVNSYYNKIKTFIDSY